MLPPRQALNQQQSDRDAANTLQVSVGAKAHAVHGLQLGHRRMSHWAAATHFSKKLKQLQAVWTSAQLLHIEKPHLKLTDMLARTEVRIVLIPCVYLLSVCWAGGVMTHMNVQRLPCHSDSLQEVLAANMMPRFSSEVSC